MGGEDKMGNDEYAGGAMLGPIVEHRHKKSTTSKRKVVGVCGREGREFFTKKEKREHVCHS